MPVSTWGHSTDKYPSGIIIPWFSEEIPSGWFLCDGNNGTPDLRGRFLKSVPDGTTDPGATGGSSSTTLATGQMASHAHGGSTTIDGAHDHSFATESLSANYSGIDTGSGDYTTSNGSHTHTLDVLSSGSGNAIENQPKFTTVYFIQKA